MDPSGVTEDGEVFSGIGEYKRHLLDYSEQVARNVVSKLLVFSTGAEIEFADRSEVEKILAAMKDDGYPMKSLIHQVVQSRLFKER